MLRINSMCSPKSELGEAIFATPAIVDDTLYARTAQALDAFKE